jgi:thiosulfate/3-mercaptopyruvate sulfurtransferase
MIGRNEEPVKVGSRRHNLNFVLALGLSLLVGRSAQAVPSGGYARSEVLIQAEELKALLDKKDPGVRIIDIREKLKYLAGHLPGAVHVWRPDLVDRNHPVPGMMAPQAQIEDLLGSMGVSEKSSVIIYSDGPDNGRLWWILAYYGFPLNQLKLLDGGLNAWKAKGYPTEMLPPKIEKVKFKLKGETPGRIPLLCTLPEVKGALNEPRKVVLDVRSPEEFWGVEKKEGAFKPGRIPGVIWIEWKEVLVEEGPFKGYWKPAEEIRKTFSAKGVTPDKDIYMY